MAEMDEPLAPDAARKLIRELLQVGRFTYSRHAKEELLADDLTTVDWRTSSGEEPFAPASSSTAPGGIASKPAGSPS